MLPALAPGDEVLVNPRADLRPGDIVVSLHPFKDDVLLVKALMAFDEAGRADLRGTNPEASTDSRTQGHVSPDRILGRVTSLLSHARKT